MKQKAYYAHAMTSYGSTIEAKDLNTIRELGFDVENPNQAKHKAGCQKYAEEFGSHKVMEYFEKIILNECDLLVFRAIPNGQILSGVAAEIEYALSLGIPVIELPCSLNNRMMDYTETKQYLIELGHYKV
jgi:nucleoside 2-deoxyribosyltransferase